MAEPIDIETLISSSESNNNNELEDFVDELIESTDCLLYTSPSPRDGLLSRMPSSA